MVLVYPHLSSYGTGVVALRDTAKYTGQLIFEFVFGILVALSNITTMTVFVVGWKKLFKNDFCIILANLVVCTSLKAFVELGFVVPYYVLQSDGIPKNQGYFTMRYEYIIFNISVFADYGVIFFSMLIAINRLIVVRGTSAGVRKSDSHQRLKLVFSCVVTWLATALLPASFYIFECQFVYNVHMKIYYNQCLNIGSETLRALIDCLVYISYICAAAILLIYVLIIWSLRRQRIVHSRQRSPSISKVQLQLLKKSLFVFVLYAASIICVILMSYSTSFGILFNFDIAYVENLLNLSIAAVYPICFLAMSGEMKSILVMKLMPRGSWMSSSVHHSSSNNSPARNEIT